MANSFAAKTPFQRGSAFEDTLTDEEVMIALQEQERQRQPFGGPLSAAQAQQAVAPFANSAVMGMQGAPTLPMPDAATPVGALAPQQEGLPGQNRLNQFLSSPGFAMASAALNNIGSGRPNATGQYQNPITAMQMSQRQNQALLMQKAKLADDRLQQERLNKLREVQMAKAQRSMDPMADFDDVVGRLGLSDAPLEDQVSGYKDFMRVSNPASSRISKTFIGDNGHMWYIDASGSPYDTGVAAADGQMVDLPGGGKAWRSPAGELTTIVTSNAAIQGAADKAGATEQAKTDVKTAATEQELAKTNQTAWDTYRAGIGAFSGALGETSTGPIVGLLPAFTAAAQKAEGASAIMAPILKTLFRESGEGTFTEGDQKLLMDMMPKRSDKPETITFKLQMIDTIVQSKLGINGDDDLGSTDGY